MRKHLINLGDALSSISLVATLPCIQVHAWDAMTGFLFFAAAYLAWRSTQEEV
jgi:hypothetical protein